MCDAAFVNPTKREQWEEDNKAVQDAEWRDYCAKVIGEAIERTAGR